jgi:TPR repeat protein
VKLKFLFLLLACSLFLNISAASTDLPDAPPAFAFNPEGLEKPAAMKCMEWIDALETERNKADCIGNFTAFKAFTKEISATIGGKYGISTRKATPEEQAALIYSITRTRHKFCGKRNMLTDFYRVNNLSSAAHEQEHLASVLTIDIMTAKAINSKDDEFFNQWSAVKTTAPATQGFIDAVKQYAHAQEKSSLVTALDKPLTALLKTSQATIATANEVFNLFAPRITLKKLYNEMIVDSEYRRWTVHGANAFAYPISLSAEDAEMYPELETDLRSTFAEEFARGIEHCVYCCSSFAGFVSTDIASKFALGPQTVVLEYIYDVCLDEMAGGYVRDTGMKHLFLTKSISSANPILRAILKRPYCKISQENILKIYKNGVKIQQKLSHRMTINEELLSLVNAGSAFAMNYYWDALFNGVNGFIRDVPTSIEICRDAADLGAEDAVQKLPKLLAWYARWLFEGDADRGIERNIPKALELFREVMELDESFKEIFPSFLSRYAHWLFEGNSERGIEKDESMGIGFIREAVALGDNDSQETLSSFLSDYSMDLFYGSNGIEKNIPEAVKACEEAANLGEETAIQNLPLVLTNYARWLFDGDAERGIEKCIPKAIEFFRKAMDRGSEAAKYDLSYALSCYSVLLFFGFDSIEKAIVHSREAADLGFEPAKYTLPIFLSTYGRYLYSGEEGIEQDTPRAIELFKEAARLGNEDAKQMLALEATRPPHPQIFIQGGGIQPLSTISPFMNVPFASDNRVAQGGFKALSNRFLQKKK